MKFMRNLRQMSSERKWPWIWRLLMWLAILIVGSAAVITAAYYFDVATESRYFCGVLCHPNRPQYMAQEVSPHADLECGVCHVGPGLPAKLMAKIAGTRELYMLVTNSFERPIEHPVNQLKSADVICEQCHTPEQFYEDQVEKVVRFAEDEANTSTAIYLTMQIGNREAQAGSDVGAHWHIDHPVWYVARDVYEQDIPWVGVEGEDGQLVAYQSVDDPLTPDELENMTRREMDCMDCHNRATHDFRNPERWVNEAMAEGRIDAALPYVKRQAMELLAVSYDTQDAGLAAMADLDQFYRSEYPDVYAERGDAIDEAVATLQEIYEHTTFPRMNLTWDFYPDNLGHTDFPGCFRCHDGEHVNDQQEPIANNCTLCHSAPIVWEGDGRTASSVVAGAVLDIERPASHREASFVWDHRIAVDDSCADCHGTIEYGTDNSSFCANGICHGQEWPEPVAVRDFEHPVPLAGAHADASCYECHGGSDELALNECAICHQPPELPHFGADCASCHTPFGWETSAAAWTAVVSLVPHQVAAELDCLSCHADGPATMVPDSHVTFPDDACLECHDVAWESGALLVPHIVEGRDSCLVCHDEGGLAPVPPTHEEWPDVSCLLCHEASTEQ
jgi:nitrate/TMAO reductase-like tetraheme cytochrome c subunit